MNGLGRGFSGIPVVVKNLIIINALVFIANMALGNKLTEWLALYFFNNPNFKPFQFITHMFMHGGWMHIFFNMFALWMFGSMLEQVWGSKRFLTFYIICGLGAAGLHTLVNWIEIRPLIDQLSAVNFDFVYIKQALSLTPINDHLTEINNLLDQGARSASNWNTSLTATMEKFFLKNAIPVVGASGAIFGVLIGFGMIFPNTKLMLIFFPVPIAAKYFIPVLMVLELFLGIGQFSWDNIAHFAHLGGALFGFILMKYWGLDKQRYN